MEIMVRVSGREVGWFCRLEKCLPGGIRVSFYTAAYLRITSCLA